MGLFRLFRLCFSVPLRLFLDTVLFLSLLGFLPWFCCFRLWEGGLKVFFGAIQVLLEFQRTQWRRLLSLLRPFQWQFDALFARHYFQLKRRVVSIIRPLVHITKHFIDFLIESLLTRMYVLGQWVKAGSAAGFIAVSLTVLLFETLRESVRNAISAVRRTRERLGQAVVWLQKALSADSEALSRRFILYRILDTRLTKAENTVIGCLARATKNIDTAVGQAQDVASGMALDIRLTSWSTRLRILPDPAALRPFSPWMVIRHPERAGHRKTYRGYGLWCVTIMEAKAVDRTATEAGRFRDPWSYPYVRVGRDGLHFFRTVTAHHNGTQWNFAFMLPVYHPHSELTLELLDYDPVTGWSHPIGLMAFPAWRLQTNKRRQGWAALYAPPAVHGPPAPPGVTAWLRLTMEFRVQSVFHEIIAHALPMPKKKQTSHSKAVSQASGIIKPSDPDFPASIGDPLSLNTAIRPKDGFLTGGDGARRSPPQSQRSPLGGLVSPGGSSEGEGEDEQMMQSLIGAAMVLRDQLVKRGITRLKEAVSLVLRWQYPFLSVTATVLFWATCFNIDLLPALLLFLTLSTLVHYYYRTYNKAPHARSRPLSPPPSSFLPATPINRRHRGSPRGGAQRSPAHSPTGPSQQPRSPPMRSFLSPFTLRARRPPAEGQESVPSVPSSLVLPPPRVAEGGLGMGGMHAGPAAQTQGARDFERDRDQEEETALEAPIVVVPSSMGATVKEPPAGMSLPLRLRLLFRLLPASVKNVLVAYVRPVILGIAYVVGKIDDLFHWNNVYESWLFMALLMLCGASYVMAGLSLRVFLWSLWSGTLALVFWMFVLAGSYVLLRQSPPYRFCYAILLGVRTLFLRQFYALILEHEVPSLPQAMPNGLSPQSITESTRPPTP
mmetsp:Transcript_25273/g.62589  ORF Transcript_25273/g.62589 Transcript_25273/m.62589 type:complete len:891 (-) Transcript_25273:488-3160(-)